MGLKKFVLLLFGIAILIAFSVIAYNRNLKTELFKLQKQENWRIFFSDGENLYFLSLDGEYKKLQFENEAGRRYPAFSPNGQKIAYAELDYNSNKNHIVVINAENGNKEQLYETDGWLDCIAWSPDGNKIIFYTNHKEDKGSKDIYILDLKTKSVKVLAQDLICVYSNFTPSWSPDSRKIVFASIAGDILTIDVESGQMNKICQGDASSWSPDGKYIIFRDGRSYIKLLPDGARDYVEEGTKYYIMASDGKEKHLLFQSKDHQYPWGYTHGSKAPLIWSPDSKYVLFFTHSASIVNPTGSPNAYIMDVKNKKEVSIGELPVGYIWGCSWAKSY